MSTPQPAIRLGDVRHDWTLEQIEALFALPFQDLLFEAQGVHREHHEPNTVQMSTLLSIKTGACPEDCAYCPQSVRFDTGLEREQLMAVHAATHPGAQIGHQGVADLRQDILVGFAEGVRPTVQDDVVERRPGASHHGRQAGCTDLFPPSGVADSGAQPQPGRHRLSGGAQPGLVLHPAVGLSARGDHP